MLRLHCGRFTSNGREYCYKKNVRGDVLAIIDINGTEIAQYVYDAWGNHNTFVLDGTQYLDTSLSHAYTENGLNNKAISEINPYRYRGYYYDTETGLYYLNARYYDSEVGRFLNADDISYAEPDTINGLNLYAYCTNNPVMYIDPEGHAILSFLIGLIIAAAIGAAVGAVAYTVSEVVSYAVTGHWSWSWGEFAGYVLGGTIGGAISFVLPSLGITGLAGIVVSAGITGVTSTAIGMSIQNKLGEANYSSSEILCNSVIVGALSAVFAGVTSKVRIPGFTGRGSISQIARQINTKFRRGLIRHIKLETLGKMFLYEATYNIFSTMATIVKKIA